MAGTATYLVRKGTEYDATRIAEIHVEAWQVAYRGQIPDDYLDSLDSARRVVSWKQLLSAPEMTVLVVLKGSRVVGFCTVHASRDAAAPADMGEIGSIYVEPAEWGLGAGRGLMAAALAHAREHGFRGITLWVLATNTRARDFYRECGFAADGAEKTEERPGFQLHELRYRRAIQPREN